MHGSKRQGIAPFASLNTGFSYTNRARESRAGASAVAVNREGAQVAGATKACAGDRSDLQLMAARIEFIFVKFQWPLSGLGARGA
jgi:hypothetical protein